MLRANCSMMPGSRPSDSLALTLPLRLDKHRAEIPGTGNQNLVLRPGACVGGLLRGCSVPLQPRKLSSKVADS